MKKHEIVHQLIEIIKEPAHWTQNYFAKDEHGLQVDPADPMAHCFCSIGAMQKVALNNGDTIAKVYDPRSPYSNIRWAFDIVKGNSAISFNDTHNHDQVIDAWRQVEEYFKARDE